MKKLKFGRCTWSGADVYPLFYLIKGFMYRLDGRPVYIVRLGSMDFKGLLKTVGEDGFVQQVKLQK